MASSPSPSKKVDVKQLRDELFELARMAEAEGDAETASYFRRQAMSYGSAW